jgi:hypothetical protein
MVWIVVKLECPLWMSIWRVRWYAFLLYFDLLVPGMRSMTFWIVIHPVVHYRTPPHEIQYPRQRIGYSKPLSESTSIPHVLIYSRFKHR